MTLAFLGKATVLYAIGNICLRAASFLLIPIYAHYLSIEDYGLLMTLLLTTQFMLVAMNCGSEHCIVRFAKDYEKSGQLSDLMGTTFLISILSSLAVACICLTLLVPFFQVVLHRQDVFLLITFTLSSALFQSLCDMLNAYYRSQHQPIKYTIVGVSTALILTVLSFTFIYFLKMGVNGALLAKVITYGWIFSIIAWHVYSKTGFRMSLEMAPKLFHFGAPLSMSSLGQFTISGASIFLLSFLSGLDSVAIFSLGYKLASVLMMVLVLPFQLSFQPYVFSQLDSPDIRKQMSRLLTYLMWAVVLGSFGVLFIFRVLLPVIVPPEFSDAYRVTLMIMPAMAFMGIFYYGETLLKTTQKSYIIGLIVVVCAAFSVLANFVLIHYISWYGASLALNCTSLVLGGSVFFVGLKKYSIPIEWRRLGTAAILFIGVLLTNFLLLKSSVYLYCTLSVAIAVPVAFAVVRSTLWEPEERQSVQRALDKLKALFRKNPPEQIESNIV